MSDFAVVVGYADFAYWMSQLAYLINYSALQLDLRIPINSVAVKRQVHASIYIYMYIYIYREREREKEKKGALIK